MAEKKYAMHKPFPEIPHLQENTIIPLLILLQIVIDDVKHTSGVIAEMKADSLV
jgi:hypothetical protein